VSTATWTVQGLPPAPLPAVLVSLSFPFATFAFSVTFAFATFAFATFAFATRLSTWALVFTFSTTIVLVGGSSLVSHTRRRVTPLLVECT
jgi:hypothetical protein